MFKKVLVVFIILASMFISAFSFPFLREENSAFVVEIQSRPFSLPTDFITPAILAQVESVTEDYAIFVWNKPGMNIIDILSGNDLEALMETYRASVFSRMSRSLLKLEIGKNRIKNGRVVVVVQ